MPRRYTFFMLLQSTPRWCALALDEQQAHHDALLSRVFEVYPELSLRHFDSTAFAGRCSDVLFWETSDVAQYHEAARALRAGGPLDAAWFEVVDVIPAVEDDGYDVDPLLPLRMCAV